MTKKAHKRVYLKEYSPIRSSHGEHFSDKEKKRYESADMSPPRPQTSTSYISECHKKKETSSSLLRAQLVPSTPFLKVLSGDKPKTKVL